MPLVSSQGSTASFDGQSFGMVLSIRYDEGSADTFDVTSGTRRSIGSTGLFATVREFDVTLVTPGSCSIEFYGTGVARAIGYVGVLTVSIGGTAYSGQATLAGVSVEAAVGEYVRGTAQFTFL